MPHSHVLVIVESSTGTVFVKAIKLTNQTYQSMGIAIVKIFTRIFSWS